MQVNPVDSMDTTLTYVRDTSKDKKDSAIDAQMFLKLLVTQLKYQDPLSPQDNTAFVTQLAQMSSVETMGNMSATLKNSQAYDMIDKLIYAEVLNKETGGKDAFAGIVRSVVIKDGIPYVVVDNHAIAVTDVLEVANVPVQDDSSTDTDPPAGTDPPSDTDPPADTAPTTDTTTPEGAST